jgi:hypothetical protein
VAAATAPVAAAPSGPDGRGDTGADAGGVAAPPDRGPWANIGIARITNQCEKSFI